MEITVARVDDTLVITDVSSYGGLAREFWTVNFNVYKDGVKMDIPFYDEDTVTDITVPIETDDSVYKIEALFDDTSEVTTVIEYYLVTVALDALYSDLKERLIAAFCGGDPEKIWTKYFKIDMCKTAFDLAIVNEDYDSAACILDRVESISENEDCKC